MFDGDCSGVLGCCGLVVIAFAERTAVESYLSFNLALEMRPQQGVAKDKEASDNVSNLIFLLGVQGLSQRDY
ncbi:hypothetical protein D3C84_1079800 [compost metagenome]